VTGQEPDTLVAQIDWKNGVLKLTAPFNPNVFGEAQLHWQRNVHGGGAPSVTVERWPGVNHYVLQVEQAMIDLVFEVANPAS